MEQVGARIASAPGRVNLLGEQIDHQGGTVLPVAIHLRTTVRYTPGDAWEIDSEGHEPQGEWLRYVQGVIGGLGAAIPGRLEITSTLPEGKGLASSAALEVAIAGALSDLPPLELAAFCQRIEHAAVGVPCGFMDPCVAACAIASNILVLDCADGSFFHLPLPEVDLFLFDSGVSRRLAETPYAQKRESASAPGTPEHRHVQEEMERVCRGIDLLDAGDAEAFGALMYESHASLRDLYGCGHPALDRIVAELSETPGVYGARAIGAGWGGSVLALVEPGTRPEGGLHLLPDDGLYRLA